MRCLEITVNGKVRQVIGADGAAAVVARVSTGMKADGQALPLKCSSQSMSLDNTHWQKWQELTLGDGDEVIIRLIEADACDPPHVVGDEPRPQLGPMPRPAT